MRRGFLKQNSEKKPLANTHNAQSPPASRLNLPVTMRGHTGDVLPADEIAKTSNFKVPVINSLSTDAYDTLFRSQRLVLHKMKVEGLGYTFHSAAMIDSRIVPLLPAAFVGPTLPPDDLCEIRNVEGKGQGVFALKDIPTGALILTEHPSIVSPTRFKVCELPLYPAVFDLLDETAAAELRTLTNSMPPDWGRTEEEGIIRRNNIPVELPVPQAMENLEVFKVHGGVLVKGSRFNHSCGPNADHLWHMDTFSVAFYAVRPIRAGEEITISYISARAPREERRTKLRTMYGFDCQCKYCDLPDAQAIARSDAIRGQLAKEASAMFRDWLDNRGLADDILIQASKERMAWAVREGLEECNHPYIESILGCYMALGDEKNSCKWARKAEEPLAIRDPSSAAAYRTLRANPRTSPFWGRRKSGYS